MFISHHLPAVAVSYHPTSVSHCLWTCNVCGSCVSASVSIKIREQLKEEEINIYQFPDCDSDEDEDFKRQDAEMKESIPFAVVGSCEVVRDVGARPVRGRRYSWGTVEGE